MQRVNRIQQPLRAAALLFIASLLMACQAAPAQEELIITIPQAPAAPSASAEAAALPATSAPSPTRQAPTRSPRPALTPTPSEEPTPSPRPERAAPRVGIQVGHWKAEELPDELFRLRTSSGAFAAGYTEAEVNLLIAERVIPLLEQQGVIVDLLPATVPPSYDADVFVTLHCDGSTSPSARGFKLATPWRTSRASQHLLEVMTAEYAAATGLPWDKNITFNMRGYYAFNYRRHQHAIAKTTPAVIVEMGFLTNARDRGLLLEAPDVVAQGIAQGILRYLGERDPQDGQALLPPDLETQRPASSAGVDIHVAPSDDARVLRHVDSDTRLIPFRERDGWYEVIVRGEGQTLGWVRKDLVMRSGQPSPTPPPAS